MCDLCYLGTVKFSGKKTPAGSVEFSAGVFMIVEAC